MGVPVAQGVPANVPILSVPVLQADMQVEFYEQSLIPAISVSDFQGELSKGGDTVRVPVLPDPVFRTYVIGAPLERDRVQFTYLPFVVEKTKYYNVEWDDVEKIQSQVKNVPNAVANHFAKKAAEEIDEEILAKFVDVCAATNRGLTAGATSGKVNLGTTGSPLTLGPANDTGVVGAISLLARARTVLREAKVPKPWYITLPPLGISALMESPAANAAYTGDAKSIIRNGNWGNLMGFEIYESDSLPMEDDNFICFFGRKDASQFVMQITQAERYRPENAFSDAFKHLWVYDGKPMKAAGIGQTVITFA